MFDSDASPHASFKIIPLGNLKDFHSKMDAVRERLKGERDYRLSESNQDGFWVFEEEIFADEEILGAIVAIAEDQVFAVSQDSYNAVQSAFERECN